MTSEYDDEPDAYGLGDDDNSSKFENIVQHLRDTLTYDMALKAYRIRYEKEPDDGELETFMDELVAEHYNAGFDEWSDEYLYYD